MSLYSRCLARAPLLTKVLTGSSLATVGDILAQKAEGKDRIDVRRTLTFGSVGAWWTGAFQHYWMNFLANHFPGGGLRNVCTKVALNQFVVHPFLYFPAFFCWNGKLRHGRSNEEIFSQFKEEAPVCIVRMWSLWIPANFVLFTFIPVPMQVLFISTVNLVWNTMLSLLYNKDIGTSTGARRKGDECFVVTPMFQGEAEFKYGISDWCKWECDVSKFDWEYCGTETAYVLQGRALVTPNGAWAELPAKEVKAGDLIVCPDGMTCVWEVTEAMEKHYIIS